MLGWFYLQVRLNSGIIHSPIHYRDVKTDAELEDLVREGRYAYKYRPNMDCQWLITAPTEKDKVGIKFQYFDLHPVYDHLEVKEEETAEVARFNGNSAVRTIISGSDHLRLTFHSDYRGEARGFGLTFQPVRVPECGGWLFAREGNLSSPNFPLFYPPTTNCAWTIQVPGPATVELRFDSVDLHASDVLEVWDGLNAESPFIASVTGPTPPTIRSLTGALHISFRSNEWGQAPGFSASFSSLPPVCGGRILLDSTINLDSPRLEGPTRRGYFSCKWELLAQPRHFITINFDRYDIGRKPHCATGYLELADAVADANHLRRYCKPPPSLKWISTSSKVYLEYFFDTEDRQATFSLRIQQTRGCVLPGLPRNGVELSCSYTSRDLLLCTLACKEGWVGGQASCSAGQGTWSGGLSCSRGNSSTTQGAARLHRLLQCRHERRTGCLAPPPLPNSEVFCQVERGEEVCRVRCGEGMVSPSGYARCERDRSGWEARWSRLLLPCRSSCRLSVPRVRGGTVDCSDIGDDQMQCVLRCGPGRWPSLYEDRLEGGEDGIFTCDRGIWTAVLICAAQK